MRPVVFACLASLSLTACAVDLPWPPAKDAFITVERHRKRPDRYWIQGKAASSDDVERLVLDTPERRDAVARADRLEIAGVVMAISGAVGTVGGVVGASGSGQKWSWAIPVTTIGVMIAGVVLSVTAKSPDPFQRAIVDFNRAAPRQAPQQTEDIILPPPPVPPPGVDGPPPLSGSPWKP